MCLVLPNLFKYLFVFKNKNQRRLGFVWICFPFSPIKNLLLDLFTMPCLSQKYFIQIPCILKYFGEFSRNFPKSPANFWALFSNFSLFGYYFIVQKESESNPAQKFRNKYPRDRLDVLLPEVQPFSRDPNPSRRKKKRRRKPVPTSASFSSRSNRQLGDPSPPSCSSRRDLQSGVLGFSL